MSKVVTDTQHYTDIANAINRKNNLNQTYAPSEMAQAIDNIKTSDPYTLPKATNVALGGIKAKDADFPTKERLEVKIDSEGFLYTSNPLGLTSSGELALKKDSRVFQVNFSLEGWKSAGDKFEQVGLNDGIKASYQFENPWYVPSLNEKDRIAQLDTFTILSEGYAVSEAGGIRFTVNRKPESGIVLYFRRYGE